MDYCPSVFQTKRFVTREVVIGRVAIGASHPIRIQSMTTYDACNTDANVEQILELVEAKCEIVRLAIQGKKQVEGMEKIKNELVKRGCYIPLVADVHFFPQAALWVAEVADKVRINPGNFATVLQEKDVSSDFALAEIERKLEPLILKCRKRKVPIRLGANSGSLSERILYLYGNTPEGMVFSALEYAEICRKLDFHDLVFSMKASNSLSTIAAYRLLVYEMMRRGWNYPIHLGVTEAGEGLEGRMKSAVGIGSLLQDGIGDTIRVSLTENPVQEILSARTLSAMAEEKRGQGIAPFAEEFRRPLQISSKKGALLFVKTAAHDLLEKDFFSSIGCQQKQMPIDGLYLETIPDLEKIRPILSELQKKKITVASRTEDPLCIRVCTAAEAPVAKEPFCLLLPSNESEWEVLLKVRPSMIFFQPKHYSLHEARKFYNWLHTHRIETPFLLDFPVQKKRESREIYLAAEMGSLLCDGIGDGIVLSIGETLHDSRTFGLCLLQACRRRLSQTEFISCPGCGRTLFDLQNIAREVKNNFSQFPGIKIAIMGCVVNGPGEMEDADFGVVGSGLHCVDLYAQKKCIAKNISCAEITPRLTALIKEHLGLS